MKRKYSKHQNPFSAFSSVFNDLFEMPEMSHYFDTSSPSVNILEGDQSYTIEIAAPGLEKEDFDIQVNKDQLTVSVDKAARESNGSKIQSEFDFNSFKRSFHLSEDIDRTKIGATYDKGILFINMDKLEAQKEEGPVSIPIS
jgi:HSP20 family protein